MQPDSPDPKSTTLRLLAQILEKFVADEDRFVGRPAGTYAVFIDFCSLYQVPRDERQEAVFRRGLGGMSALYSHPFTWILKATAMPAGYRVASNASASVWPSGLE